MGCLSVFCWLLYNLLIINYIRDVHPRACLPMQAVINGLSNVVVRGSFNRYIHPMRGIYLLLPFTFGNVLSLYRALFQVSIKASESGKEGKSHIQVGNVADYQVEYVPGQRGLTLRVVVYADKG